MHKSIIILAIAVLSGCATYSEPGYDTNDSTHKYEGRYTNNQRADDSDRNRTIAERQGEYDRHQDRVQNRSTRQNIETRRNIVTGLAILGSGYGVYNIERRRHERSKYRSLQQRYNTLLGRYNAED